MTAVTASPSFAAELLAAADRVGARPAIEEVLTRWAGQRIYLPTGVPQRGARAADLARQLVRSGVGTRAAAALVRDRFGLSPRQARRLVRAEADVLG